MEILYEDEYVLAVHKRAGLATQTAKLGEKDLVSEVLNYLKKSGKEPFAGVINRLDQPVEGIVLFGLDKKTIAALNEEIRCGETDKHYYAAVLGDVSPKAATVADFMVSDEKTNLSRIAESDTPGAKRALLEYKVIAAKEDISLLDIHLITGRHHQIRLQMSSAGFPLLGDKKYGSGEALQKSEDYGIRNIALCAYSLSFRHPITNEQVVLKTEVSAGWKKLFD